MKVITETCREHEIEYLRFYISCIYTSLNTCLMSRFTHV